MMKNVPLITGKQHCELIVIAVLGFLVLVVSLPMISAAERPRLGEEGLSQVMSTSR